MSIHYTSKQHLGGGQKANRRDNPKPLKGLGALLTSATISGWWCLPCTMRTAICAFPISMTHGAICFPPRLTPMRARPPVLSIPFSTAAIISIPSQGSITCKAVIMILRSEDLSMRMDLFLQGKI